MTKTTTVVNEGEEIPKAVEKSEVVVEQNANFDNATIAAFYRTHGMAKSMLRIAQNVTIEPVMFLSTFAMVLTAIPTSFLLYDKVCIVEQNKSVELCNKILYNSSYRDQQDEVQTKATNWMMIGMGIGFLPDIVFKLLAGNWSDKHGRKPIIIIIITGTILKVFGIMANVFFSHASIWYLLLAFLPASLFSTSTLFPLGIAYISDITVDENRTSRIFYMQLCSFFGEVCGQISGGIIKDMYGYYIVYIIALSLSLTSLLYCVIMLKEKRMTSATGIKNKLKVTKDFFNVKEIKESFKILIVKREGYKRLHIILLIAASLIDEMLYSCREVVDGLYTQVMYNWSSSQMAKASTIIMVSQGALFMIAMGILMGIFKLPDLSLATIGFLSALSSYVIKAFSKFEWMFYFGSIICFLGTLPTLVIQSNLTKLVEDNEIGKLVTMRSAFGAMTGPQTNILFMAVYKTTRSIFYGFTYLVTAIFYLVPILLFVVMKVKPVDLKKKKEQQQEDTIEEQDKLNQTEMVTVM